MAFFTISGGLRELMVNECASYVVMLMLCQVKRHEAVHDDFKSYSINGIKHLSHCNQWNVLGFLFQLITPLRIFVKYT